MDVSFPLSHTDSATAAKRFLALGPPRPPNAISGRVAFCLVFTMFSTHSAHSAPEAPLRGAKGLRAKDGEGQEILNSDAVVEFAC